MNTKLKDAWKKSKALFLKMTCSQKPRDKAQGITKNALWHSIWKMMEKGTYTPASWDLAHLFVKHGCYQGSVGLLLQAVAKFAGADLKECMSWTSVIKRLAINTITFTTSHFLHILKGMNGDHANDQKKTVQLIQAWKHDVSWIDLGWEHLLSQNLNDVLCILMDVKTEYIAAAGSAQMWDTLNDIERDAQAYNECARYWAKNKIEPLVLLANKDNDATIALASLSEESSEAVACAV
ncbi:uncharacterized protein EV420DRAFT_1482931 [Desarmillaria tabescens]|uniref:Uncharacterized protein n=1 Tax=Armillaria tabescens TaxID=1929756 RepID=A0AA39MY81_ARMTA|nr:uncharacterized protein EV420DRAFT_1482931 [Desarmillaria tabescens]KAK0450439.1 hypothetical protein EV420DRAFT_1482931 [Desarmillaria tabescens]